MTLAEIDPARIARLEQDLALRGGLITWVYGGIFVIGLVLDAALLVYWRSRAMLWRERISRLIWRPIGKQDAFLLLAFLGALQLTAGLLLDPLEKFCIKQDLNFESLVLVLQTLIMHVAGLTMVVALLRKNRVPWKSAFGLSLASVGKRVLQGAVFLLATMPLLFFYTFVYHLALQSFDIEAVPQDVLFAISEESSWLMRAFFVVLAAVLAPAFEEVMFRGILLPVLAKRFRASVAIAVVSTLFALVHWNVGSFVPLFVLSASFCLVYIYTESLMVPMVMHGLFNTVTVSTLFYAQ